MAHLIMGEKIYYHKRHPGTPCKKFSVRASCTVEASIVMPVFLFISACILLFFYVLAIEWSVAVALNETAREAALYGGEVKDKETIAKGTVTGLAYAKLISNKTPASHVKGRALGFDFSESVVDEKDILLIVKYTIPFPVKLFGKGEMKVSQQAKAHRWVGFDPSEGKGGDNETVFVTKYGKAWHSLSRRSNPHRNLLGFQISAAASSLPLSLVQRRDLGSIYYNLRRKLSHKYNLQRLKTHNKKYHQKGCRSRRISRLQ